MKYVNDRITTKETTMMKPSLRLVRWILIAYITVFAISSCKSSNPPKAGKATNTTAKANEKKCESNHGTWQKDHCQCAAGYKQGIADKNICVLEASSDQVANSEASCQALNREWDYAQGYCKPAESVNYATQYTTDQTCAGAGLYWQEGRCVQTRPTTQLKCRTYGDEWTGSQCTSLSPGTKYAHCTSAAGKWDNQRGVCICTDGQVLGELQQMMCPGAKAYPKQNAQNSEQIPYPNSQEQAQCQEQYGANYMGEAVGCQCPVGFIFNANYFAEGRGFCVSTGQVQYECPGAFRGRDCYNMNGEQLIYDLLMGWIFNKL